MLCHRFWLIAQILSTSNIGVVHVGSSQLGMKALKMETTGCRQFTASFKKRQISAFFAIVKNFACEIFWRTLFKDSLSDSGVKFFMRQTQQ